MTGDETDATAIDALWQLARSAQDWCLNPRISATDVASSAAEYSGAAGIPGSK